MIQTLARHKLALIGISLLVAVGVWYGLSASAPAAPDLVTTEVAPDSPVEEGLVATLLALRTVKLEGTILTDPVFVSLQDFSTEIVPEPIGRENPFAPLTSQAPATANSTRGAQIFNSRP